MNFNQFLDRIDDINFSISQKKRLFDVIKDVVKDNVPEQKDDFKQFILQNFGTPIYINFKGIIGVNNSTGVLYKDSKKTITIKIYNKETQTFSINVNGNSNKNKWIEIGPVYDFYLFNFIKYEGSIRQVQEKTFRNVYAKYYNGFAEYYNGFAEYRNGSPIKEGDTMLIMKRGEIINCYDEGDYYSPHDTYWYLGNDCLVSDMNSALIIKNPCYIENE